MAAPDLEEVILLEQSLADDLTCQVEHTVSVCTVHVTHLAASCGNHVFMCTAAAKNFEQHLLDSESGKVTHRCKYCKKHLYQCWRVVPV